jgi:DNA-binding SARP family transcriptional activator
VSTPEVRVLGQLTVDGADVLGRLDRKGRTLLRLLALARGRPVPAEALAEALWAEAAPSRPADQVAVLASRARRIVGRDHLQHGDHGYRLHGVALDVDQLATVVAEAERRLAAGETGPAAAAGRMALTLVRGVLPDPASDADWVRADHAAVAALVRRSREVAAEALLAVGAWPEALEVAAADARTDSYDEAAWRAVMRAHVLAGRPALALAAYADLRASLADELGTDPAPETESLHTAVLRGDVGAAVPSPGPQVVGRGSQLAHLDSLVLRMRDDRMRVAVVTGEAGIGKTTMLRTWSRARTDAGDTVLSGTCGPLDASAPLDVVLAAIGDHLRQNSDAAALLGDDAPVLGPLIEPGSERVPPQLSDPVLGPATLYAAVTAVLSRIAGLGGAILVVDDAHLAGPALADWVRFASRRPLRLLVVAAVRPAEGQPIPATDEVGLGPLDLAETLELVGAERAEDLYARSGGHPLFLAELAGAPPGELPPSLVDAVVRRCADLGPAGEVVRTAAVLGSDVDLDLLASVLDRPVLEVLGDVELALERGLLEEYAGRYTFRHELVRTAIAAGAGPGRVAVLHARAAGVLSSRPDADPLLVAEHARLGGADALAATALRRAADRAAARFDHETTAALLDRSLALVPDEDTLLARARVRIRLTRYREAEADVGVAEQSGAAGAEIACWAAYFDRRFDDAVRYAQEGELLATDDFVRARCLVAEGRVRHARGDLAEAEEQLGAGLALTAGPDRLAAAAWLGVLMAHRSRVDEAVDLLRPATRQGTGPDQTSAVLHALLFTGHAHALAGRPAAALEVFERYGAEVERRHAPRFAGRGVNFGGWVLRNVGEVSAGVDAHQQALEVGVGSGTAELRVAALEDLAEGRIDAGDLEAAGDYLEEAKAALVGDLVFGWRLAMKLDLLQARWSLRSGDPGSALELATGLRDRAGRRGVPRYASVAALLVHQSHAALGEPVDLDRAWRDLADAERSVRLEAWRWAGETGSALGQRAWLDRAAGLADELAGRSAGAAEPLRAEAARRLDEWALTLP